MIAVSVNEKMSGIHYLSKENEERITQVCYYVVEKFSQGLYILPWISQLKT